MVFLVIPLSGFQPFCNKIDIPFGRPDPGWRLLLERVEDVHRLLEPNGVHRSIGVSVVRLDDLQDARTKPLPRLRRRRGPTELRNAEGVSHVFLDRRGKAQEVALGGPHPMQRLLVRSQDTSHHAIIPILG
jgi:hypothetical protein